MARIEYPDPSTLSAAAREELGERPANVTRMLSHASEGVFTGYAAFGKALINKSSLPAKLREIAILRVGYLSRSGYELYQHEAFGRHVGLTDAQIAAVEAGDPASPEFEEAEAAVLAFADDLVANVRASDATLAAVRRHLDDTQVVDLILATGAYMMVCRFLETTGVDIDDAPIDWESLSRAE